jgi:hypothetical protein
MVKEFDLYESKDDDGRGEEAVLGEILFARGINNLPQTVNLTFLVKRGPAGVVLTYELTLRRLDGTC